MRLKTSVVIGAPTNVDELFAYCQTLLGTPLGVTPVAGVWKFPPNSFESRHWYISNPTGLGPTELWVNYADGPMRELPGPGEDAKYVKWREATPTHNGFGRVEVDFATEEACRGERGETFGARHVRLITAFGKWLDVRGLPWKWGEFGGWHDRFDGLGALAKFAGSGGPLTRGA